jgi:hypothetical protein
MPAGSAVRSLAPALSRLLDAWEAGQEHPLASRTVCLLAAAYPDLEPESVLAWTVGRRDLRLLALREAWFGPDVLSVADCPACGERLETRFSVADAAVPTCVSAPDAGADTQVEVEWEGRTLRFRLPTVGDLVALEGSPDLAAGRCTLLGRCSLDASLTEVAALPAPVVDALSSQLGQADPQADVQLALACPACEHGWSAVFDIAAYLWAEVDAWAQRTLLQVHALARAYGWTEAESLALSPRRRQRYLTLIADSDRTAI